MPNISQMYVKLCWICDTWLAASHITSHPWLLHSRTFMNMPLYLGLSQTHCTVFNIIYHRLTSTKHQIILSIRPYLWHPSIFPTKKRKKEKIAPTPVFFDPAKKKYFCWQFIFKFTFSINISRLNVKIQ